jgi:hypothetical protein
MSSEGTSENYSFKRQPSLRDSGAVWA